MSIKNQKEHQTKDLKSLLVDFAQLNKEDQDLFIGVVVRKADTTRTPIRKQKKFNLPDEFSVDSFYSDLVANHNYEKLGVKIPVE